MGNTPEVPNIFLVPNVLLVPNVIGYTVTGGFIGLTSLQNVKNWLALKTTTDDAMLLRLIVTITEAVLNYLQRGNIYRQTNTEFQSGVGNAKILLENWPVLSVSALKVGTASIPAQPSPGQLGYVLPPLSGTGRAGRPQPLILQGYCYERGSYNVGITYQSGYAVQNEQQIVASTSTPPYIANPNCPYGPWAQDDGVTYAATGAPLTLVSGNPTIGQYAVSIDGVTGIATYQFCQDDSGAAVNLNYSYTPSELEQACIEWIAERFSYKSRIGQMSHSLGGQETTSFSLKNIPDFIALILRPYKKWFPL